MKNINMNIFFYFLLVYLNLRNFHSLEMRCAFFFLEYASQHVLSQILRSFVNTERLLTQAAAIWASSLYVWYFSHEVSIALLLLLIPLPFGFYVLYEYYLALRRACLVAHATQKSLHSTRHIESCGTCMEY
jgi:hypothetical protein